MARPLRIEFAGALYHITARGNARQDIFLNRTDREEFLNVLHRANERYHWYCHAYCLMSNHYHLLIETQQPTLSKGMKYINGVYTQQFNKRHKRVGHVFQGRFKGILVEGESYLLELARYIVLNPVRDSLVRSANEWPWSSYKATAGMKDAHPCLAIDWILSNFGKQKKRTQESYRQFIQVGKGQPSPWALLKNQIYLGSDKFVEKMQCKMTPDQSRQDIPRLQKLASPKPLDFYQEKFSDRKVAMANAYLSGHYTLQEVGEHFEVSYATVSRAVKSLENVNCKA